MRGIVDAISFYLLHPSTIFLQFQLVKNQMTFSTPFVFVVGPPRSGTTLMHRLLMNHSHLYGFNEETAIFSFRSIFDFKRFQHIITKQQHQYALEGAGSLAEFCIKLHETVFSNSDEKRYVEKTPQHAKWLKYIGQRMPNAQFIFCVRDPKDTFCSAKSSGIITQAKSIKKHAEYFNACCADLINAGPELKRRIYISRYEDFVTDPKQHLENITNFLYLPTESEVQLDMKKNAVDQRSKQPEFQRLSQKIDSSTVGRWRNEMKEEDVQLYQTIAKASIRHFNYDLV